MTLANMQIAPSPLPTSLAGFGEQFTYALANAGMMGPLVTSDTTNYATEEEKNRNEIQLLAKEPEQRLLISTIWAGKNRPLPPAHRFLPRLFLMPGVPASSADMESIERMRALPPLREGESFFTQLSFFSALVELTETSMTDGFLASSSPPREIVNINDILGLEKKWMATRDHDDSFFAIIAAAALATSRTTANLETAADKLRNVSARFSEQGLTPLGAIALETARDLYMSAAHGRTWKSTQASYDAASYYRNALMEFKLDPLEYGTMLKRGLTIAMDEAMHTYAFGPKDNRFMELARILASSSVGTHAETKPMRAVEDKARMLWLKTQKAHSEISAHWVSAGDLIDEIANLLLKGGKSDETAAAVHTWAKSAREFASKSAS
ncbi:MAG: hypothetical protein ABH871_00540 [Pseudomonadota bacterium]